MPIIKSAKKRVRITQKATARNKQTKKALRLSIKNFQKASTSAKLSEAQSAIDTAVKKGLMHPNKAARRKRQLAAAAKAAGAKVTTAKKTTAAKTATKKPVAKAPPKTATKKTTAKKPAKK